ncbi:MAG: aldolase/citrate lyase family protein [Pseudomonadota bacterium]|nr:aldolase/citrate lyase family protein [Pseudomonadota bacterium]
MSGETLRQRLASGKPLLSSWIGFPGSHQGEVIARSPFDAMTIDMQHGLMGFEEMAKLVAAAIRARKPVAVRVPLESFGLVGRALDTGADAVIMPMVNSMQEAERLVALAKYPPAGSRSWGAYGALLATGLSSQQYLERANRLSAAWAMIETREALACADAICSVAGLDGVFVGPGDLTISLSGGKTVAGKGAETQRAIRDIARAAQRAGVPAGIFCATPEEARRYAGMGYRFLTIDTDDGLLADACERCVAAARRLLRTTA